MRLRSSQFVFLLLLVCTVNVGDDCIARLLAGSIASPVLDASQVRERPAPAQPRGVVASSTPARLKAPTELASAARSAHRIVWTMRRPASHSTAISSFTGFFRA